MNLFHFVLSALRLIRLSASSRIFVVSSLMNLLTASRKLLSDIQWTEWIIEGLKPLENLYSFPPAPG